MMARYPAQYSTFRVHISSNSHRDREFGSILLLGVSNPKTFKTLQWLIKNLKWNYVIWLLFKGASGYQLQPTTAFVGENKYAKE